MQTRVGLAPLALAFWALRRARLPPRGSGLRTALAGGANAGSAPLLAPGRSVAQRTGSRSRWPMWVREEARVRRGAGASRREGSPGLRTGITTCEALCIRTEGSSELCWDHLRRPDSPSGLTRQHCCFERHFRARAHVSGHLWALGRILRRKDTPCRKVGPPGQQAVAICASVSARAPCGPQATAALRSSFPAPSHPSSTPPPPPRHLSLCGDHRGLPAES